MDTAKPSLGLLARAGGTDPHGAPVPRPPFRWTTRVVLPLAILAVGVALFAYVAWSSLVPAVDVRVVPVVAKPPASADDAGDASGAPAGVPTGGTGRVGGQVVQAPGWIEPRPFATSIAALTDGVIKEVLVLEGQHVEAGQVVARFIDDDVKLRVARADADRAQAAAEVEMARARVATAEARIAEVAEELNRRRPLTGTGAVPEAEIALFERKLRTAQEEAAAARAEVAAAEAMVAVKRVVCDEERLALRRMDIVSPIAGVILSRNIEPGVRVAMAPPGAGEPREAGVMTVYDPKQLQVRVSVPLVDAAKVAVGTQAEITTETLPDTVFKGVVDRVVYLADIQRNTVEFKVVIDQPSEVLKPDMLAKVRFFVGGAGGVGGAASGVATGGSAGGGAPDGLRLMVSSGAIVQRAGTSAKAWVIDQSATTPVAMLKDLVLGAEDGDGNIEVVSGVRAGDRIVVDPPAGLRPGARVRIQRTGAEAGGEGGRP